MQEGFAEHPQEGPRMAIVDVHAHIYPNRIAQHAVESVRDFYGAGGMFCANGTGSALLESAKAAVGPGVLPGDRPLALEEAAAQDDAIAGAPAAGAPGAPGAGGVTHFVVHSVATKARHVKTINSFIAQECAAHAEFVGFAAMHQDYADPEAEINRAIDLGLCGIKVHPDTQRVNADDPRLMVVYEIAQAKGLPVIIHAGDYRYDFSHPRRIRNVVRAFPDLRVDAAHFGGWSLFDLGADVLRYENCYVDTSSSFEFVGLRHAAELIALFGSKRVLFGSDFPMWNPQRELAMLRELGYSEEVFQDITWHNAERFLGRTIS